MRVVRTAQLEHPGRFVLVDAPSGPGPDVSAALGAGAGQTAVREGRVLLANRFARYLRERFPDENLKGATLYGLMRTLQMRRMRLPKPQVARGEAPRR